jgi:hypothetical protein
MANTSCSINRASRLDTLARVSDLEAFVAARPQRLACSSSSSDHQFHASFCTNGLKDDLAGIHRSEAKGSFVRTGDLSAQCYQGHYRLHFFSGALKSAVACCFQASQYDRISVSASRSRSSIASNASTFT